MREQRLTYYPLTNLDDVNHKIIELGKVWKTIEDISIKYTGGAYSLSVLAIGIRL